MGSTDSARGKYLEKAITNFDITKHDTRQLIQAYNGIRGVGGDVAVATDIMVRSLKDPTTTRFLTMAGSADGQGLMNVWPTMVDKNMYDAIMTTGAIAIDMHVFHAMGFDYFHGNPNVDNEEMGELEVNRMYDANMDERELVLVDETIAEFLDSLKPMVYSPHQVMWELGKWLSQHPKVAKRRTLPQACYENGVPYFCLGLTDSSFGMGSTYHQLRRVLDGKEAVQIDTTPEYADLAKIKLASQTTGFETIGGGLPTNHVQDTIIVAQGVLQTLRSVNRMDVVSHLGYAVEEIGDEVPLHKYAVKVTVADVRDGACSSSTLEEARTWGKVDLANQKMVYAEATLALPIMASAAYHTADWSKVREKRRWADWLNSLKGPSDFGKTIGKKGAYMRSATREELTAKHRN
jgi:deoxyhypusine synthase